MNDFLSRKTAAEWLSQRLGRRVTATALARHASEGTGPRYSMILGRATYRAGDLDRWVRSLIQEPSTRSARPARPARAARPVAPAA